jgi:hypothetical protein
MYFYSHLFTLFLLFVKFGCFELFLSVSLYFVIGNRREKVEKLTNKSTLIAKYLCVKEEEEEGC